MSTLVSSIQNVRYEFFWRQYTSVRFTDFLFTTLSLLTAQRVEKHVSFVR